MLQTWAIGAKHRVRRSPRLSAEVCSKRTPAASIDTPETLRYQFDQFNTRPRTGPRCARIGPRSFSGEQRFWDWLAERIAVAQQARRNNARVGCDQLWTLDAHAGSDRARPRGVLFGDRAATKNGSCFVTAAKPEPHRGASSRRYGEKPFDFKEKFLDLSAPAGESNPDSLQAQAMTIIGQTSQILSRLLTIVDCSE